MRRGEDIEGSRIPSHWILRGMLLVLKEVEFPLTESTDDLFFEPMRCTLYKVPQALQNREDFDFIFSCMDTHAEVFVWVGQSADSKEKQKAFEIGQMYIELAVSLDGLSPDVTVYKVTEGNEPCFFTTYFSWDSSKATVHGNSFEKKLAWLFGSSHASRAYLSDEEFQTVLGMTKEAFYKQPRWKQDMQKKKVELF